MSSIKLNLLIKSSMLAALSVILSKLEFPIIPMAAHLKYDVSNIPVLLGSFIMGPFYGFIIIFIKSILQGILTSPFGAFMGFLASSMYVLPASWFYAKNRSFYGGVKGLFFGSIIVIILMVPTNYLAILIHDRITGINIIPPAQIFNYCVYIVPLFNLIKCVLDSTLILLVYKKAGHLLRKNDSIQIKIAENKESSAKI